MMKSFKIALLLALMLPVVTDVTAAARPTKSSSFKSGFSSGKSSSASPSRSSSPSGGGFGSFGSRSSTPAPRPPVAAPAPSPARSGGFGSFGSGTPRQDSSATPQKSDSALSQRLSKGEAQANAIRTYDERKAAEQVRNAPPPVVPTSSPSYGGNGGAQPGYGPAPAPIIINNGNGGGGFGNIVTGFLLGRAMSPSHAQANGYPGNTSVPAGTVAPAPPGGSSFFMSVLRTFAWLLIIAVVGWALYFGWKFLRRGSAASQANYSFDRN